MFISSHERVVRPNAFILSRVAFVVTSDGTSGMRGFALQVMGGVKKLKTLYWKSHGWGSSLAIGEHIAVFAGA